MLSHSFGLAANKSIETLAIDGVGNFPGEVFAMLIPFFHGNGNLKSLKIDGHFHQSPESLLSLASALEFCSLESFVLEAHFSVHANGTRDVIQTLVKGHSNLKTLKLNRFNRNGAETGRNSFAILAGLLQMSRSVLTELDLRYSNMGDEEATNLAIGLASNSSLQKLDLSDNQKVNEKGWQAIFLAMQSPVCMIEELSLCSNVWNDAIALSLGDMLIDRPLKALCLCWVWVRNRPIAATSWRAIFEGLQSSYGKLEALDVCFTGINDDVMAHLGRYLDQNTTLRDLSLYCNRDVTSTRWNGFLDVLLQGPTSIEELHLGGNDINDAAISIIANSRVGNKLKALWLQGNEGVTATGWMALSTLLQSPYSALEQLQLFSNDNIDDGTMISLANALSNNTKLKVLFILHREHQETLNQVTAVGWAAFVRLLCNKSSIMATYDSNHTLEEMFQVCDEDDLPEDMYRELSWLLYINRENSNNQAARLKIIESHFAGDNIDVQPFIRMELKTLPHAIAWMTADCDNDADGIWGMGHDLTYEVMSRVLVSKLFW